MHSLLVGIVNVTPDSFSDGGHYANQDLALSHAKQLIADGADILDIGAESTRPGATPISAEEEWQRVGALLEELQKLDIQISFDSRHPANIKKALQLGIHIVNDVSGLENPEMIDAVKDSDAKLVLMHHLGIPSDKSVTLPANENQTELVLAWAKQRLAELESAGIARNRILFDPGIGFGKTAEQSLKLLQDIEQFKTLDVELFVGHSRKSFLTLFSNASPEERDEATLAASLYLASKGVKYLRVHNIAIHRRVWPLAEKLW